MPDRKVVQCFGTQRKQGKPDKPCRRQFLWTASALSHNFGGKGVQACPYCGTMPDFQHPFNRFLGGELSEEAARAAMPKYLERFEDEK